MSLKYFERIVNNLEFNFVPIFSFRDNSILGYRIIKYFSKLGFNDKEYMYQLAYDMGIFENFTLQLLKKAYTHSIEKNFSNNYLFYTLRLNYIKDIKSFFHSIDKIVDELNLDKEKIVFDIKGIDNWSEFHNKYSNIFSYNIILRESRTTKLNINSIINSQALFIEPRSIDTLVFIKASASINAPFIFNLKKEKELLLSQIKALGIDYYYNY